VKPLDFCTSFGDVIPVALCTVDLGRNLALRTSDATRVAHPHSVSAQAQTASARTNEGASQAAHVAANVKPDAQPSSTKFTMVSGVAHSWRKRSFGKEGHTFLFGLSDGRVIDGSLGGNSARWLNHACVANCEAVESNGRVHIHAVSDIESGEELFITYGLSVEGRLSAAVRAQYECRCGHHRCRGTMLAVAGRLT